MKTCILLILSTLCTGTLLADPPEKPQADPQPGQNLGEAKIGKPPEMQKTGTREGVFTQARHGVIGQFVQAPRALDPISPFAKPELGQGQANLSKDTMTGRIMGLRLVKFEF
jgi:hypothetical protein